MRSQFASTAFMTLAAGMLIAGLALPPAFEGNIAGVLFLIGGASVFSVGIIMLLIFRSS